MPISQDLPKKSIDNFSREISIFLKTESNVAIVLLLSTVFALIISNSPLYQDFASLWDVKLGLILGNFEYSRSLHGWINDGLMTLFFFLVSLELKREIVFGSLKNPRVAGLSIFAAVGGMIVPVLLYLSFQYDTPGENGWGTVMATDTAFVVGCLALLGKKLPQSLRVFMLSVAIIDDIGAILVIALGYTENISLAPIGLSLLGIIFVWFISKIGVRSILIYYFIGIFIWFAVDMSGVHPTITGVILGLMTPAKPWITNKHLHAIMENISSYPLKNKWGGDTDAHRDLNIAETAAKETISPLERLEIALHPWVGYLIMPIFAISNAGIVVSFDEINNNMILAVIVAFVVGKPLGIITFSFIGLRLKLAKLPENLDCKLLLGGGFLSGIGFTIAILIADMSFTVELINSAKLGIIMSSILSSILGILILRGAIKKSNIS